MKKLTTKEFILKAKKVHGKKYLYHEVDYVNSRTKVKIRCRKCKKFFWQKPANHLIGKDCKSCSYILRGENKRKSYIIFEREASKIHYGFYAYNQDYINNYTKIKIICPIHGEFCPIHGEFKQKANNHLNGRGCNKCKGGVSLSFYEFEKKANVVHSGKYTYHQDYLCSHDKIKITCPIHGNFYQSATSHLCGNGCSLCSSSLNQLEIFNLISKITRLKFRYNIYLPELQSLELDMYNSNKKLAIEYNGEGHYVRYTTGWGFLKKQSIFDHQKRDNKKKRLCKKYNIKLVIIPCYDYTKLKTTKEKRQYLMAKIKA